MRVTGRVISVGSSSKQQPVTFSCIDEVILINQSFWSDTFGLFTLGNSTWCQKLTWKMAKFPPPENFDFTRCQLWPEWRQRFECFRIATKLHKELGEVQVCTLLYSLGKEAEQVFKTFRFAGRGDDQKYETVLCKLDNYFVPKVNVIHERARFHQCVQRHGESTEEFIRSLHEMVDICVFAEVKNENIRDRLVVGILDKELSEKLQLTPDLTLDKAVELVRQSEQVKGHVSEQGARAGCSTQLNEVAKRGQRTAKPERRHVQCKGNNANVKPAQDKRGKGCYRCGKPPVNFIIDTGADTSVISEKTFSLMKNKPQLKRVDTALDMPGGRVNCLGYFTATTQRKQKQFKFKVHVISGDSSHLLGRNVAIAMGLVKPVAELKEHKTPYPTDVGILKIKPVMITLKEDAVPYSVSTASLPSGVLRWWLCQRKTKNRLGYAWT